MAAGSAEPLAKPSAARVTQGRNRQRRRRTPQEPDSPRRALRLHPINSLSQCRLMVVAQGRASCLAPHLFAVEARPGRRLAARTWIRAPPRLPNTRSLTCQAGSGVSRPPGPTVACAPYPSRSTTAAARWHSPSTPFHRAAQEETPPLWRGSWFSACAVDDIDAAIGLTLGLGRNLTMISQTVQL